MIHIRTVLSSLLTKMGLLIFGCAALGTLISIAIVAVQMTEFDRQAPRAVVPVSEKIYLSRPGNYTVFYEYRTILNGQVHHASPNLPVGLDISIERIEDSSPVKLNPARHLATYGSDISNQAGIGVYNIDIPAAGEYVVRGSYRNAGRTAGIPVVLVFKHEVGWHMIRWFCITLVGTLAGLVIGGLVVVFLRRRRNDVGGEKGAEKMLG